MRVLGRPPAAVAAIVAMVAALGVTASPSTSTPPPADEPLGVASVQVPVDEGGHRIGAHEHGEYVTAGTRWRKTELTYGFVNHTADLSVASQEAAIAAAFDSWAAVTPLTFSKVADCGLAFDHQNCTTPDIRISWGSGQHTGSGWDPAFDGQGGVAAHAFYPPPNGASAAGDLHLDDAERWTTSGNGVDLQAIVLHELGHALGLGHATAAQCPLSVSVSRPIMCGTVLGADRTLAQDDINGVQALYGAPPLSCGGYAVTVDLNEGQVPTSGADVILGTPGNDTINAGSGADIVCGGAGNDRIDLGAGNDRAIGGGGNEVVYGRTGVDRLEGGAGNDKLLSGGDNDDLYGGSGADQLDGGTGSDRLYAGAGGDRCNGRGGRDSSSGCERSSSIERRTG